MPLNSAEVAAMAGQYQQMHVGQSQYSSFIGGMSGLQGSPGVQADQIAGGLMNRVSAIGAPLASLGVGLMGLDPMSIGIKAGMGAYASGAGLAGAGVLGLGAAGAVAVPMAVAGYAANQMWTGAQQQQAFNQNMRGAFSFMTPGGQGFTGQQLGQINQGLFSMAGQHGPGGDMLGVRELQGLAVNMGRMGMAGTGAQDVSQFSQKFREMVNTLKVVAKEMGTSMQAAQEFVVAMRSSGIFNSGDQRRLATEIRQFAQAGNMATSELTAAANIGAQVSRAIGGRGGQGAFAGIRTIGTIGAAMQAGVLSDEDLYNATGLTGAEGRQALAARQLEQSGNFLRTGRGRMFLASVAGQNGQLDPSSVQDWLSGGMGIGDTRASARRNLSAVGRAGFLRNEGRLRGAALEQFGGMLPSMALMQWAGSKGIDINTMDDRSMLFASRSLGMGMDELENAVKMARNMPAILEQQRSSNQMGDFQNRMANVRRTQGIEGVQRRFEEAREKVQGSLQRVGAQMYTDLSSMIERTINEMTGVVIEEYDQKIMDAYHDAMGGAGTAGLERRLGMGRGGPRAAMKGLPQMSAGGMTPGSGTDRFFGRPSPGTAGSFLANTSPVAGYLLFGGESDYDRMKKAGYGSMFQGVSSADDLQKRVNMVQGAYTAAQTARAEDVALGRKLKGDLRTEYAVGDMQGARGAERVDRLAQILGQKAATGDKDAQAALDRLTNAGSKEERLRVGMQMLTGVETGAGIAKGARTIDVSQPPEVQAALGRGYATEEARNAAYGAAFMGRTGDSKFIAEHGDAVRVAGYLPWVGYLAAGAKYAMRGERGGRTAGLLQRAGLGGLTDILQAAAGATGPSSDSAIGEYLNSNEGKSLIQGVYSGDASSKAKIEDMLAQPDLPPAKRQALKGMLAASGASELLEKAQKEGRQPTEAEWAALAKQHGMRSVNEVKNSTSMVSGIAQVQADQARRQFVREASKDAAQRSRSLQVSGFAQVDKAGNLTLSADVESVLQKSLGAGSDTVVKAFKTQLETTRFLEQASPGSDASQVLGLVQRYGDAQASLMGMSTADQLKAARALEAAGYSDQAAQFRGMASSRGRVERALKKGGGAYALGSALGIGFKSQSELRGLQALAAKDGNAAVGQLLAKAGLSGDAVSDEDRAALAAALKNKDVTALANIAAGQGETGRNIQGALREEQRKKSEQAARDQNPLMSKMEEHLKRLADSIGTDGPVATAIVQTSSAAKGILANTKKDSDTESSSSSAPQPGS